MGPPASSWRLILRDGDELECPLDCCGQDATTDVSAGEVTIRYSSLRWRDRNLPLRLRLTVRLDGEDSLWQVNLENGGAPLVTEIWCPVRGGVGAVSPGGGATGERDCLLWPEGCGRRIPGVLGRLAAPHGWRGYNNEARRLRLFYPGPAAMQWYALAAEDGGLYLAAEDSSFTSTCLNVEGRSEPAPALVCSLVKYPFLEPEQSWHSPLFRVSAYSGPWQAAAARYRRWAEGWWTPPQPPRWIADLPGWVLTIMKQQTGEVRWRYNDLLELLSQATLGGLDTLFLFGWFRGERSCLRRAGKRLWYAAEGGRMRTRGNLFSVRNLFWVRAVSWRPWGEEKQGQRGDVDVDGGRCARAASRGT